MHKILRKFFLDQKKRVNRQLNDKNFKNLSYLWTKKALKDGYIYNFTWEGIPIIKFPSDLMVFQEIIQKVKPDLIIETGVAHGGSLIFYASIQEYIIRMQEQLVLKLILENNINKTVKNY